MLLHLDLPEFVMSDLANMVQATRGIQEVNENVNQVDGSIKKSNKRSEILRQTLN
jgi:hypothetical protein